jgi:hypothetical protein
MPLVLQVVEYRHLRAPGQHRRGEAGVQKHAQPVMARGGGQRQLLPQNPGGAHGGANRLRRQREVRRIRRQVRTGFAVCEEDILVAEIGLRQSLQQAAQIDLGAADSAWNQV